MWKENGPIKEDLPIQERAWRNPGALYVDLQENRLQNSHSIDYTYSKGKQECRVVHRR